MAKKSPLKSASNMLGHGTAICCSCLLGIRASNPVAIDIPISADIVSLRFNDSRSEFAFDIVRDLCERLWCLVVGAVVHVDENSLIRNPDLFAK